MSVSVATVAVFSSPSTASAADSYQHEEGVVGLGHAHAFLLHRLGQTAERALQLVLHLHLGHVRIGAGLEGQGHGDPARRGAFALHVEEVVQAGHVLLDDLHHVAFHGAGRGAPVGGGDTNRSIVLNFFAVS